MAEVTTVVILWGLSSNTCKIIKPDGSEIPLSYTNSSAAAESGYYRFSMWNNLGSQVNANFKTAPEDGEYPVYYGLPTQLPAGNAILSIVYDGNGYEAITADDVKVTTINGKKKVTFENIEVLYQSFASSGSNPQLPG